MKSQYEVEVGPSAKRDLQNISDTIAEDKPGAARRWLHTFWRHAESLSYLPFRYEVIPEAEMIGDDYRHLLFGNYRIIYRVSGNRVTIVRVFHAARLLKPEHFPRRSSSAES